MWLQNTMGKLDIDRAAIGGPTRGHEERNYTYSDTIHLIRAMNLCIALWCSLSFVTEAGSEGQAITTPVEIGRIASHENELHFAWMRRPLHGKTRFDDLVGTDAYLMIVADFMEDLGMKRRPVRRRVPVSGAHVPSVDDELTVKISGPGLIDAAGVPMRLIREGWIWLFMPRLLPGAGDGATTTLTSFLKDRCSRLGERRVPRQTALAGVGVAARFPRIAAHSGE
jgi:hypothetical protein